MQQATLDIKKLIMLGLVVVLFAVIAIGASNMSTSPQPLKNAESVTSTSDAVETDIEPLKSNIDTLKTKGLSVEQIDALQFAYYTFAQKNNLDIRQLVMDVKSAKDATKSDTAETGVRALNYDVSFGDKQYKATISYSGVFTTKLLITEKNGSSPIFDSGDINGYTLE